MKKDILAYAGNGFTWLSTLIQANETLQLIQFIASIIVSLLTILFIIWKWYKKAKEDGKIEPNEVEDLIDDIKDELEDKENK